MSQAWVVCTLFVIACMSNDLYRRYVVVLLERDHVVKEMLQRHVSLMLDQNWLASAYTERPRPSQVEGC